MTQYVDLTFPRPLHQFFTYSVPPDLAPALSPGVRVRAPFGRVTLVGYCAVLLLGALLVFYRRDVTTS